MLAGQHSQGMALVLMLTLLSVLSLIGLLGLPPYRAPNVTMATRTAQALQEAKASLLAYAAAYPLLPGHEDETYGYFPLPDMGGELDNLNKNKEGWAATGFSGNSRDVSLIGRLPWRTLRLAPLKDEYGECLWYAISGNFKNNPKSRYLNWDSTGLFETRSSPNASANTNPYSYAAVVIFAPGPVLTGQDRRKTTQSKDAVDHCHGNYDAHNYLDPYDTSTLSNSFPNSSNSGIGSANVLKTLITTPQVGPDGPLWHNDRAITILPSEIFALAKKQTSQFEQHINSLISKASACLPNPDTQLKQGALAASCAITLDSATSKWLDQFFYIICAAGQSCVTVNSRPCQSVLIFAGERSAQQMRVTSSDKSDPANYLEGQVLATYRAGTGGALQGAERYQVAQSSADVLLCVPSA